VAGVVDDITNQKENYIGLQEALSFQKLLLEVNTDLVFVKDDEHRIVEANQAFINLYPKEVRQKVIGYTTVEDYDAGEAEAFLAQDKKAFTEGMSEVVETILFPDNQQRTLLTKKLRFEDSQNNKFILGICRDITQLKETEERLIKANEELEEFAYRTSHDLRSPLISSKKLLQVIQEKISKGDTETSLNYLDLVIESLTKLEELVSDILRLTKLEHSEFQSSPVNIEGLIEQCLQKFSYLEGYSNVQFSFDYQCDNQLLLQLDPLILILENLLSNAIKYQDMEKEQSTIHIEVYKQGHRLVIAIEDNGLGIPEASRKKVFSMFKRFHPNTSFGSGLGLYMVKKSVDKIGGTIEYNGDMSNTQFIVTLPLS
jgi:PAS domain S-box-containing protein